MHRQSIGSDGAERLANISLFADLSPGQRRMLGDLLDQVVAESGEVLMAEGTQGFELMMIEQGTVEVCQAGERINTQGPGEFFGELSVLGDGQPRTATVRALSDVRCLLFSAHSIRQIHDRMPAVGARMDEVAQQRLDDDAARQASSSAPTA